MVAVLFVIAAIWLNDYMAEGLLETSSLTGELYVVGIPAKLNAHSERKPNGVPG